MCAASLAGCGGAQRAIGGRPAVPSWQRTVQEQPHGTIYFGGAGLDGPYVEGMLQALRDVGITNVSAGQVDTARHGFQVDSVVLIGSPIGPGLLGWLRAHPRIGQVLVIDLAEHGDPIRAGMPQGELTQATPQLVRQMLAGRGEGHFHYALEGAAGRERWAALAARLRVAGLR